MIVSFTLACIRLNSLIMKFLHCLVVLVALSLTCCYGDKEHDDDDYIDPFDMVNFDPVTKTMKNKENKEKEEKNQENKVPKNEKLMKDKMVSEEEKVTSDKLVHDIPPVSTTHSPQVTNKKREDQKPPDRNAESLLFRQFVKKLISYFQSKAPDTTQEYHVWVKLSKDQYGVLQKFADGKSNIHDAQEILVSMITDVTRSNVGTAAKLSMWFEEKTGALLDNVLKMVTIMSLISMVLYMEIGLHISWRRRVTQLIMLAFVISIPMTWYELYQTAQINQQTVTMKEAPKECVQDIEKEDWLTFYTHAFKHIFTFQEDNCQKYYEHMLIDPLLKVTPTKRWDFFSRARNVFSDLGDKISDAADDVGDFAEGVADRAREGIVHAVGHLEDFGDKAGDRIGEAAQDASDAINNL